MPPRLRSSFSCSRRRPKDFFLGQLFEAAVFSHALQFFQPLNGLLYGFEVGEHAAQPAMTDKRHTAAGCFGADRFASRTFGADKEDRAIVGGDVLDELKRLLVQGKGTVRD